MPKFYEFKNQTAESRDMYMYGDIVSEKQADWWTGEVSENDVDLKDFRENVEDLTAGQTLNIYINSGGGSVFAASTMISMLKRAKERGAKIVTYIDGLAGSAASMFPMAADETHIYSNSMMMIHKPLSFFYGYYNGGELQKAIDELDAIEDSVLVPLYESRSQLDRKKIKNLLNAETWMNAQQISETFDNITLHDEAKNAAACVSDYFNKYRNTPAAFSMPSKAKTQNSDSEDEKIDYTEYENILKLL